MNYLERTRLFRSLSFEEALGLLFIGLKLTAQIDWSWWIVLIPLIVELVHEMLIVAKYGD